MIDVVAGIDIGGTNTEIGLVSLNGKIHVRGSMKTRTHGTDFEAYINDLAQLIDRLISKGNYKIIGIGIGAPNGNMHKGTIENAPNLDWKGIVPLCNSLKNYFPDCKILLTNDANAAALGEKIFGAAKDIDNFITITLGTGVGSGIISNGKLVIGHDGLAGEVGHMITYPKGRLCGCGRRGCLETYASASGIVRTATELLATEKYESVIAKIPFSEIQSKDIADAANNGDKLAIKTMQLTGETLGFKLADVVAVTSPKKIFIAGGVAKAKDLLLNPIREHLELNLLSIYKNKITVELSGLPGIDSAILGAAALIWNN